jgi:hypothetical protein
MPSLFFNICKKQCFLISCVLLLKLKLFEQASLGLVVDGDVYVEGYVGVVVAVQPVEVALL